jgi:hypothetical protein
MVARGGTWLLVAIVALAVGAALVRFALPSFGRVVIADGTHEIISRAPDSEIEVSSAMAASSDGSLGIAWVAMRGGNNDDGHYIGVRVSAPHAGPLGPLLRLRSAEHVASPTVAPLGSDERTFVVAWLAGTDVYAASVTQSGASASVRVLGNAHGPPRAALIGPTVYIVAAGEHGATLSATQDGATFAPRELPDVDGRLVSVCGDEHRVVVTWLSSKRAAMAAEIPNPPDAPVVTTAASLTSEHVARDAPTCFIADQEVIVAYGITDKATDEVDSALVESLVFARSKDHVHTFYARAPYHPPAHLLHPALLHGPSSFTVVSVLGGGVGDSHASASMLVLNADGRSQNGITRTVVSPVTLITSPEAAGYTGESLGVVEERGVTRVAVPDNASGESHIALVQVQ